MVRYICCLLLLCIPQLCHAQADNKPYMIVLGVAQDGGYPHMGCTRQCCNRAWANDSLKKNVVSLALVDPVTKQWWLLEATPDIKQELHEMSMLTKGQYSYLPAGIFITHAHIGHYTGLMQLGKEVMGTNDVPVYVLPKMAAFLTNNGPWSQLVQLHNIVLHPLTADSAVAITSSIHVTAFTVPHRDEYSETAGFRIVTSGRRYLFIPDINKWQKWDRNIVKEVSGVDAAFVDATFYSDKELPGRNMSEIPHPMVTETMDLFAGTPKDVRAKIWFIHFNHTNPLLWDTQQQTEVRKEGFNIAAQGQRL